MELLLLAEGGMVSVETGIAISLVMALISAGAAWGATRGKQQQHARDLETLATSTARAHGRADDHARVLAAMEERWRQHDREQDRRDSELDKRLDELRAAITDVRNLLVQALQGRGE